MTVMEMVRLGFVMNLICLAVTMAATMSYGYVMFDLGEFPDWAQNPTMANETDLCGY